MSAITLARIFNDVTNSYKFLFFLALLENAEQIMFAPDVPILLDAIIVDMFVIAWYPHIYFRLSFGKQDRIGLELDRAVPRSILTDSIKPYDRNAIRALIRGRTNNRAFERYVPYRLIRPFFPETSGIKKDHEVNSRVSEMCEEYFTSRNPPYKFDKSRTNLLLHPAWASYFKDNLPILRAWAHWNLLDYMQKRNPNVPGIAPKLFPPPERQSLERQTKFWRAMIEQQEIICIYSGEPLNARKFTLDHFIPWSFVVHNQLWNLIPASPSVNSAKSDRLPSLDYISKFTDLQHAGLTCARAAFSKTVWEEYARCFISDLALPDYAAVLDRNHLGVGFTTTLMPLIQLATSNGFEPGWIYT